MGTCGTKIAPEKFNVALNVWLIISRRWDRSCTYFYTWKSYTVSWTWNVLLMIWRSWARTPVGLSLHICPYFCLSYTWIKHINYQCTNLSDSPCMFTSGLSGNEVPDGIVIKASVSETCKVLFMIWRSRVRTPVRLRGVCGTSVKVILEPNIYTVLTENQTLKMYILQLYNIGSFIALELDLCYHRLVFHDP